jgi:hypothetical protein
MISPFDSAQGKARAALFRSLHLDTKAKNANFWKPMIDRGGEAELLRAFVPA